MKEMLVASSQPPQPPPASAGSTGGGRWSDFERQRRKAMLGKSLLRDARAVMGNALPPSLQVAATAPAANDCSLSVPSSDPQGAGTQPQLQQPPKTLVRPMSAVLREEYQALEAAAAMQQTQASQRTRQADANTVARMEVELLEEEVAMTQEAIRYLRQTAQYVQRKPVVRATARPPVAVKTALR